MAEKKLLELFFNKYTTKAETMYRLPISVDIEEFWPEELAYRQERATNLPLHSFDGKQYMFNMTEKFVASADRIAALARDDEETRTLQMVTDDSMIEEAFYSSAIEGAYSTRERARAVIASKKYPEDKNEQMIYNNYYALQFALANLDEPFTHELIQQICEILTGGVISEDGPRDYRDDIVYVMSATGETAYTAPDPKFVKPMMEELLAYLNEPMIHPVEKAVITHIYFVIVHPFFDGNGRTARALTYMVLLKSAYDFFRYAPISGILASQRGKYYKAIRAAQDRANGYDLTYFAEYYADLLAQTLDEVHNNLNAAKALTRITSVPELATNSRLIRGAQWLMDEGITIVTAGQWKEQFGVSFETARSDLMALESVGFVRKEIRGRKMYFVR